MHSIVKDDIHSIIAENIPWRNFENKTVLISGAAGFLPAYMVHTLMALNRQSFNIKVIALVRNREKGARVFSEYLNDVNFILIGQDVCEPAQYDEPVDYIIHAASQASPKYYGVDPVGTMNANILGTHQMLSLARKNALQSFLLFSSSEVYGQVPEDRVPIKENTFGYLDPLQVRSCYAESKRMAETMCVSWMHQYGIPAKIIRPFHIYGPGMALDDGRVFADFTAHIVKNKDIVLKSDGKATRAFCYLKEAVQGFFTVLLKGQAGEAYNIGNDRAEISILDLARTLVNLYPEKALKVICEAKPDSDAYIKSPVMRSCPDIEKVRALGWQPSITIAEGFQRTIASYL